MKALAGGAAASGRQVLPYLPGRSAPAGAASVGARASGAQGSGRRWPGKPRCWDSSLWLKGATLLCQDPWHPRHWEGAGSNSSGKIVLLLLSPRANNLNHNVKTHEILTYKQMQDFFIRFLFLQIFKATSSAYFNAQIDLFSSSFSTEKKRYFSLNHTAPSKTSNDRKPVTQGSCRPAQATARAWWALCFEETPALPRPPHAAFKRLKTCSSKLGELAVSTDGAHCSPGVDQDQFPVNPQDITKISSHGAAQLFSPQQERGLGPHRHGGMSRVTIPSL